MTWTTEDRVRAGVALLDKEKPGWREGLDLSKVQMEQTQHCILGEVYGDFFDGLRELGLVGLDAGDYGFDTNFAAGNTSYVYLKHVWKRVLEGMK